MSHTAISTVGMPDRYTTRQPRFPTPSLANNCLRFMRVSHYVSSHTLPGQHEGGVEMDEAKSIEWTAFIGSDRVTKAVEPGDEAFGLPAAPPSSPVVSLLRR